MKAGAFFGRKGLRPYINKHLWDDSDPATTRDQLQYFVMQSDAAD